MAIDETFVTVIGCMDGRCQEPILNYGKRMFKVNYADTITEPGIVGTLSANPHKSFLSHLKKKLHISLKKHEAKGIIVHGHSECAGNPIPDDVHKKQIENSVETIKKIAGYEVPVIGVFVTKSGRKWHVEEVSVPEKLAIQTETYPFLPIPRLGIRRRLQQAIASR